MLSLTATHMMILKEENNFKIHRLRVIYLYEADLNFLLGLKWKEAIHLAFKNDIVHCGHFGGQPGRDPTNYKYCHNSVNIRDIRDISAYLSTTDIIVYQGIYGI